VKVTKEIEIAALSALPFDKTFLVPSTELSGAFPANEKSQQPYLVALMPQSPPSKK